MTDIVDMITVLEPTQKQLEYAEYEKSLRPGKSIVLAQIVDGGSHLFEKWNPTTRTREYLDLEFWEFTSEGGSAAIENEAGMLEDAIAPMVEDYWHVGWVCVEGFYGYYSKDYYGEVDCDYECDNVRPARWSDYTRLMGPKPWWARADRYIPQLYGHPGTFWQKLCLWWDQPVSRVGEFTRATI